MNAKFIHIFNKIAKTKLSGNWSVVDPLSVTLSSWLQFSYLNKDKFQNAFQCVCLCVWIGVYVRVCVCVCVFMYMYIYI